MVKDWIRQMFSDGVQMQQQNAELSQQLHKLISGIKFNQAQAHNVSNEAGMRVRTIHALEDADSVSATAPPPLQLRLIDHKPDCGSGERSDSDTHSKHSGLNQWTQQLFERLASIGFDGDTAAAGIACDDTETWKRDLIDLLFLAPGVQRCAPPPPAPPSAEGGPPPAGSAGPVRPGPAAAVGLENSEAAALLRALTELRRVDEILRRCTAFWENMEGTVQQLSQMKEHTQQLVMYTAKNSRLKERFEQRLEEYSRFWASLECLCRQYCFDIQAASQRMYEFINKIENAADVIDAARGVALGAKIRDFHSPSAVLINGN